MSIVLEFHSDWRGFGREHGRSLPSFRLGFVTVAWAHQSIRAALCRLREQVGDMRRSLGF